MHLTDAQIDLGILTKALVSHTFHPPPPPPPSSSNQFNSKHPDFMVNFISLTLKRGPSSILHNFSCVSPPLSLKDSLRNCPFRSLNNCDRCNSTATPVCFESVIRDADLLQQLVFVYPPHTNHTAFSCSLFINPLFYFQSTPKADVGESVLTSRQRHLSQFTCVPVKSRNQKASAHFKQPFALCDVFSEELLPEISLVYFVYIR